MVIMNRSISWRLRHLIHNVVAHPLLPLAELFDNGRWFSVADIIYRFHDSTIPEGDAHNQQRYL